MKPLPTFLALSALSLLSSCAPNFAKRQKGAAGVSWMSTCVTDQFVKVEVVSTRKPGTTGATTLAQLPERPLRELIESLGVKLKNTDSLAFALATEIKKKPKEEPAPYPIFGTTIDRRLVIKVDKVWALEKLKNAATVGCMKTPDNCGKLKKRAVYFNDPGDRIMNLEMNLRLDSTAPFVFADWDAFKSQYLSVNLGSVSSTLNLSMAAEVAANASGSMTNTRGATGKVVTDNGETGNTDGNTAVSGYTLGPKVTGSVGSQYVSSQTLANQFLRFNGILRENGFTIRQDGAPGSDLSGNSEVSITMKYTGKDWLAQSFHRFQKLFDDKGAPAKWDAVTVIVWESFYPDVKQDVAASVDFNFLFRNVTSGRRHIPESRQRVTHAYGRSKPTTCVLLKAADLRPTMFKLVAGNSLLLLDGTEVVLQDAAAAAQLLTWLRRTSSVPSNFTIDGNAPVTSALMVKQF